MELVSRQVLASAGAGQVRALASVDPSQENIELKHQFELRIAALMKEGVVETEVVEYKRVVGGSPRSGLRAFSRSPDALVRDAREEMTWLLNVLSARLLKEYWNRGASGSKPDQERSLPTESMCWPRILSPYRSTLMFTT